MLCVKRKVRGVTPLVSDFKQKQSSCQALAVCPRCSKNSSSLIAIHATMQACHGDDMQMGFADCHAAAAAAETCLYTHTILADSSAPRLRPKRV